MFPCATPKATDSTTCLASAFDDYSDGAKVTGDVLNWNSSVHIHVVSTGRGK